MPTFSIPNLSLVVLIGPSGSGKTTFARQHFLPTEVLSSDNCRGLVSDDENNQTATNDAFDVLHYIAAKRLAARRLTVVDATNVQREARQPLVRLAREYHVLPVAVVFNLPEEVCQGRNAGRADRDFGLHVVRQQQSQLRRSLKGLKREGSKHGEYRRGDVRARQSRHEAAAEAAWKKRPDYARPFRIAGGNGRDSRGRTGGLLQGTVGISR
jgi:protein phosphatase